jgi:carbon starvation protein CstA
MVTFLIAIVLLVLGYLVYSKIIERILVVDPKRATPAVAHPDGVDYVPMKPWRIYLIQFLNIAGVGPICGAIMGAQFGSASFLWIVFGSIFAGAVHDFIAGFISIRRDGASLPEIHGAYLGNGPKQFMRFFTVFLMILVGAVFVNTPAVLLNSNFTPDWNIFLWVGIIFAYYLIATLLPIDKLIGKIYPIFGFLLLGMAVAIVIAFVVYQPPLPELWDGLQNQHPDAAHNPIFPMMFISIACGAISGFHATQSPLMARCMTNERQGRHIFYGAMIVEGIVALIWAAAASYFYNTNPALQAKSGPAMVSHIANTWFPMAIAVITVLGVISAAVTSGDTALRSARLIVADFMHLEQRSISKRLWIAIPMFAVTGGLLVFSLASPSGFQVIWQYFSWANQMLAAFTLWAVTVYLRRANDKPYYWIALIPALFMTMVTVSFIFVSKTFLGAFIPRSAGYILATLITIAVGQVFFRKTAKKM